MFHSLSIKLRFFNKELIERVQLLQLLVVVHCAVQLHGDGRVHGAGLPAPFSITKLNGYF